MHINGAIILITSAGTLIGSMLAERMAQLGAKVVLTDCHYDGLINTYEHCKTISDDVYYCHTEDYSLISIQSVFDFINTHFQQSPDVLINNWPNATLPSITDKTPIETFTLNIASLTSAVFSYVQICTEKMRKDEKEGVVVNIISHDRLKEKPGYEHTASLMSGFTQTWAKELHPFKIRVGGILPTFSEERRSSMNELIDELTRNTEYIVENQYFSGRVMSS